MGFLFKRFIDLRLGCLSEPVCGYPENATTTITTIYCDGWIPVFGGNAPQGSECAIPFIYKGVTYDRCITVDHELPWCSTTFLYEDYREWGHCLDKVCGSKPTSPGTTTVTTECEGYIPVIDGTAPDGSVCHFPFIYRGVEYNDPECSTVNNNDVPWCYVDEDFKKWGNCEGKY